MAQRDHSLDAKIIEAATAEFLAHGFRDASLRQIARRAGISTGALYTRYENKDVLFCSLVAPAMQAMKEELQPIANAYMLARDSGRPEAIMAAIKQEEAVYLQLMFRYYEQCVLFFCCSDGSSIQQKIAAMMETKAQETMAFLKAIAKKDMDLDGIEMILLEQFQYYRLVLEKGYPKDKAISCMKTVESFMEAGWKDLFEKIM